MSAPVSRPVHPCILSLTEGTRGAEFSCWAYMTSSRADTSLPNLVTASASTLSIYSIDPESGTLCLEHCFGNLAGTLIFLAPLEAPVDDEPDALLVGFAGQARLAVLSVMDPRCHLQKEDQAAAMATTMQQYVLRAESLVDLTALETAASCGAVPEQDMQMCMQSERAGLATVTCVLGGGIAVVVLEVAYHRQGTWIVPDEPYLVPLVSLEAGAKLGQQAQQQKHQQQQLHQSISTGFGDIISVVFLPGFVVEPVVVLLHSGPNGRTISARLGREKESGRSAPPLYVTAISVSVPHARTAVLWSKTVTADALYLQTIGSTLVSVGASALVLYNAMGNLQQVLAVNGFAHAACPSTLALVMQANPVLKLSLALDGSCMTPLSDSSALVALRTGQLYVLQQQTRVQEWTMLPAGQKLGTAGEVAWLSALPFDEKKVTGFVHQKLLGGDKPVSATKVSMGLVFAGSRLGDSLLLGYALEKVNLDVIKEEEKDPSVKQEETLPTISNSESNGSRKGVTRGTAYDENLRREEEALYAPVETSESGPHVVPLSDEEEKIDGLDPAQRKRQRMTSLTILHALSTLDVLVNPGPLGPSCEGPITKTPDFLTERVDSLTDDPDALLGATGYIFPSGFDSSGGLSVVTAPGRDDRTITTEMDCRDIECMFSLPVARIVLLGMSSRAGGGISVLRVDDESAGASKMEINEVDAETLASFTAGGEKFTSTKEVLQSTLLGAGEFTNGRFIVVVKTLEDDQEAYSIVRFDKDFNIVAQDALDTGKGSLLRLTPFSELEKRGTLSIAFGCLWSSGEATIVVCDSDGGLESMAVEGKEIVASNSMEEEDEDSDARQVREFYLDPSIVALDVFKAPKNVFERNLEQPSETTEMEVDEEEPLRTNWSSLTVPKLKAELKRRGIAVSGKKADLVHALEESDREAKQPKTPSQEETNTSPKVKEHELTTVGFDEEDELLYSTRRHSQNNNSATLSTSPSFGPESSDLMDYVGICRQSGHLEVYLISSRGLELQWSTVGCGVGSLVLDESHSYDDRMPSIKVSVQEMRFFSCGPTDKKSKENMSIHRSFCLMLEKTTGDFALYKALKRRKIVDPTIFMRVQLRSVGRPSKEQSRHHTKLVRKGIVESAKNQDTLFRMNYLHRFAGISGQEGLFATGSRPFWTVGERGMPTFLVHRMRHAAPAGGSERPVRSFCSGLRSGCFLTLHERVGRVGSQRLTLFDRLSNVFQSHGLLSGGGLCVEKIFLGVTVRRIQFIEDESLSSGSHPLYAVLISREIEEDQRALNSDGLTPEQRKAIEEEKERSKIQKQVEADLGGFDIQTEWVEEIEREDCFEVDTELGGAPPARKSIYSLWIVDAANNWAVVDSFDLDEYEHGISMQVMSLTVFKSEPGSASALEDEAEEEKVPFIAVGTGIVDHNGEDVTTKGRALLFNLRRNRGASGPVAELSLAYEKEIFHGAVSTLGCLSVEGKNRLVIGAGSDVNIEQFGNGKLTQVGFFRATMQVLDILLFKNFFLLSDAYDSLYFLVWRESDKSLTLLAKDYDPIVVYAAGLMSRGPAMTFLCHDDRQNLQFFQYAPGEAAARGGNKLVCRADCHLGTSTTSFMSHFCRSSLLVNSATPTSTLAALKQQDPYSGRTDDDHRLGIFFGTSDGGIGGVVPLSEPVFWRLTALQSVMANALEANCALNHRAWRLYRRSYRRGGCRSNDRKKSVVDGDLIIQYANLPIADQEDLAASIGSTVDLILDNILEIQCSSLML